MNGIYKNILILVPLVALFGCNTLSEGQWNTAQTAMSGSPAVKREVVQDCIKKQNRISPSERNLRAKVMNVRPENYASAFCNRIANSMASGRMTYKDYRRLQDRSADNSKVLRIMQGR